ncbi:hypothetical protein D3C72_1485380 [compost metagenome]
MRIDQLVADRRGIGQKTQPAEGVDTLVMLLDLSRNGLPRDTVEAVTACDEVAVQAYRFASPFERDIRLRALHIMKPYIGSLIDRGGAGRPAGIHQVAGHFSLTIDQHRTTPRQCLEVQAVASPPVHQFNTLMHEPFRVHTLTHAGLAHQVDGALLQHPGADAPEHVLGRLALQDDVVDARARQQLPQ